VRVSAGVAAAVGSDREWLTNDRYRRPGPGRVSATHRAALRCAAPRRRAAESDRAAAAAAAAADIARRELSCCFIDLRATATAVTLNHTRDQLARILTRFLASLIQTIDIKTFLRFF